MGLFIMPAIVRNLTVARFLCAYWVLMPPLEKFMGKRKYLANRFSQMNNLKIALSIKYSSAKTNIKKSNLYLLTF